jgi:hypothetical protein
MSDTGSFLAAVAMIMLVTLGMTQIIDKIKPAVVKDCSITFKDYNGNKHTYVGRGEVF